MEGRNIQPLTLEFPIMFSWGASINKKNIESEPDKYSLALQFPRIDDQDNTPQIQQFLQQMRNLEEKVIKDAVLNSEKWWGRKKSEEVIRENFGHPDSGAVLKYSKDKITKKLQYDKPPSIKVKLMQDRDQHFQFGLFDEDGKLLYSPTDSTTSMDDPFVYLPKFVKVKCLVSVSVWFVGSIIYPVFTLKQAICRKPMKTVTNYTECLFKPLSSTEKNQLIVQERDEDATHSEETTTALHIEDSDEESDEELIIPVRPPIADKSVSKPVVVQPPSVPTPKVEDDDDDDDEPIITVAPKKKIVKTKKV
jgi:hypothetical protein